VVTGVDFSESVEMYLEAILELETKNSVVRSVDIARFLGVTKPSVSRAMTNLKNEGYVLQEPYGDITFTDKGRNKAVRIHELHHIITDFLVSSLGISPDLAEADACRMEHVISPEVVQAMKMYNKKRPQ
jgi:Mn-dependent DtxR family transcriptional regulator